MNYMLMLDFGTVLTGGLGFALFIAVGLILSGVIVSLFPNIPEYALRKILHVVAFTGVFFLYWMISTPWDVVVLLVICGILIIPLLKIVEKTHLIPWFFVEKSTGEIGRSLVVFLLSQALIVAVFEGLYGQRWLVCCQILMWGMGDAAAAIFGHLFGKTKITWPLADQEKTYVGCFVCIVFAFIGALLGCGAGYVFKNVVVTTFPLGLFSLLGISVVVSLVEVFSKKGRDTLWMPLVASVLLHIMSRIIW